MIFKYSQYIFKFCLSFLFIISIHDNAVFADNKNLQVKNKNKFSIIYKKPIRKNEFNLAQLIKNSVDIKSVSELINEEIKLAEPVDLVFGGDDGPLFDSKTNTIIIPYAFLKEVKTRFIKAKYPQNSALKLNELVIDAVMHTIFHELAHALIFQFDLPVLGKEEDAADGLASVFLIEYFEQGQEILITAADLFDLESQDIEEFEKRDFWDEHSLDIQRYYSSMCHVYGSAPKQYKQIKKDEGFSNEKAENCIDDYEILVSSWLTILKPYLVSQ